MLMSEYITGEANPLNFKREFRLFSATPDFRIRIKLFCLKMRTSEELFWVIWIGVWRNFKENATVFQEKLNWGLCSTSKIIYQNHLTHQYEEKTVLQPSFKLCADATLTSEHINQSSAALNLDTYVFDKLEGLAEFDLTCDCVNKNVMLSGFLDMGTVKGEVIFWDRRWCILRGCNIWLYNYPQDELWGNSVDRINLEYCVGPLEAKVLRNWPKKIIYPSKWKKYVAGWQLLEKALVSVKNISSKWFEWRRQIDAIPWIAHVLLLSTLFVGL